MTVKFIKIEQAKKYNFGCAFIDNLTLLCALRALQGYPQFADTDPFHYRPERLYPAVDVEFARADKCDYILNDAFRLAIDVCSLAQLVESIVLFDKAFVDSSYIDRWGLLKLGKNRNQIGLPCLAKSLDGIVVPVIIKPVDRAKLLANAINKAMSYGSEEKFADFFRLLSMTSVEGAFIQITDEYFETGFSDRELYPDIDITKNAINYKDIQLDAFFRSPLDFGKYAKGFRKSLENLDRMNHEPDNHFLLKRTNYYAGDVHSKMGGSLAIIHNAVAAFFYQILAAYCDMPYFPHVMRSYFVIYDQVMSRQNVTSSASSVIDCMKIYRKTKADPVNAFYNNCVIDVNIPFFLAMVLEEVDKPDDILEAAAFIRKSEPAKAFRSWSAEIDQRIAEGSANLDKLQKEILEIEKALKKWTGIKTKNSTRLRSQISVSFTPISLTVPLPDIPMPNFRPKSHLVFIQRLAQVSNNTLRFEALLSKVYGGKIAKFWSRYREIISQFSTPEIVYKKMEPAEFNPLYKRLNNWYSKDW